MKSLQKIFLAFFVILIVSSCKKTYDEGPAISLRSKINRITGKWRLVSMEGVPRLNPSVEQYIELTKEEISDKVYRAYFTNFQDEDCTSVPFGETLYTEIGTWAFVDGKFGGGCNNATLGEELKKKEGLGLLIYDKNNTIITGDKWKILRLTNEELVIINDVCVNENCYYGSSRKLTFEKE
jgi:hypothetical protein